MILTHFKFAIIGIFFLLISSSVVHAKSIDNADIVFKIIAQEVCEDGTFNWATVGENGAITYSVEQYLINRWVTIANVEGDGIPLEAEYSVKLNLNSGQNKVRVKYKGINIKLGFSQPLIHFSQKKEITMAVVKNNKIEFSDYTYYVLYNPYGTVIMQGDTKSINISDFPTGTYCVVYDNRVNEFEKKKWGSKSSKIKKKQRSVRNPYSRYKIS